MNDEIKLITPESLWLGGGIDLVMHQFKGKESFLWNNIMKTRVINENR